jgi:hypothetical protein
MFKKNRYRLDLGPGRSIPIYSQDGHINFFGWCYSLLGQGHDVLVSDGKDNIFLRRYLEKIVTQAVHDGKLVALIPRDSTEARLVGRNGTVQTNEDHIRKYYFKASSLKKWLKTICDTDEVIAEHYDNLTSAIDLVANRASTSKLDGIFLLDQERRRREFKTLFRSQIGHVFWMTCRAILLRIDELSNIAPIANNQKAVIDILANDEDAFGDIEKGIRMVRAKTKDLRSAISRDARLLLGG